MTSFSANLIVHHEQIKREIMGKIPSCCGEERTVLKAKLLRSCKLLCGLRKNPGRFLDERRFRAFMAARASQQSPAVEIVPPALSQDSCSLAADAEQANTEVNAEADVQQRLLQFSAATPLRMPDVFDDPFEPPPQKQVGLWLPAGACSNVLFPGLTPDVLLLSGDVTPWSVMECAVDGPDRVWYAEELAEYEQEWMPVS